jgi:hypothetical protein
MMENGPPPHHARFGQHVIILDEQEVARAVVVAIPYDVRDQQRDKIIRATGIKGD